ncbi:MAG TPA: ABC transporter permease [Hyphomicrobiales bacterium]|nr:ABC transporter permease [Hyphomicrobiales bacterium]
MFWRHLKAHFNVVFAMMTRAMLTQHNHALGGYIWTVLEPAGMVVLIVMAYSFFSRTPLLGDSISLFYCVSYLPFILCFRYMSNSVSNAIRSNLNLLNFPRVNAYDAIIGEFLVQYVTNWVAFILLLTGDYIIIKERPNLDIPNIFIPMTLLMLMSLGIGMINAVLYVLVPTWQSLWRIINRPLLILSGIFHLPSALPPSIRHGFMLNPLANVLDWIRVGFYPGYTAPYANRFYVVEWAAVSVFIGLLMLRVFRRKVVDP